MNKLVTTTQKFTQKSALDVSLILANANN